MLLLVNFVNCCKTPKCWFYPSTYYTFKSYLCKCGTSRVRLDWGEKEVGMPTMRRVNFKLATLQQNNFRQPLSGLIVIIVVSQRSISHPPTPPPKIVPLTNCLNLLSKQLVSQEQPALISLNQGVFCDKSSSWVLGAAAACMLGTLNKKQQTKGGNLHLPEQHSYAHCPCEHIQAHHSCTAS